MAKAKVSVPKTPGYYWAHVKFHAPPFPENDRWEPVQVHEDGEVGVIGKEWADTAEYWGIVEFGPMLVLDVEARR